MPLSNFNGKTFVAFLDISGFKELMKNDQKAIETLNHFYQTGFDVLRGDDDVAGLFISDCGVLFVKNENISSNEKLEKLLTVIKSINQRFVQSDVMLTTSIAYGYFSYQEKIEFPGIEKNQVYGGAYAKAFFDNENGQPKIQPGQCRILKNNLPEGINRDNPFLREKRKHFYYYWNVQNENQIDDFLNNYNNSYNRKYMAMLESLKSYLQ